MSSDLNIFYKPLQPCKNYNTDNSYCKYYVTESGTYIVCVKLTSEFINYCKKTGNEILLNNNENIDGLSTCICIYKWIDSYNAGIAPKIIGESTSLEVLKYVPMEILKNYLI